MTIYQSDISNVALATTTYQAIGETDGIVANYRDSADENSGIISVEAEKLKFDLTYGFSEQILSSSVRFKLGNEVFIDRTGTLYKNIDMSNGSGVLAGQVNYGNGEINIDSWLAGADNKITLESLTTTTDIPPISHVSFRTPIIPIRPQSLTVVVPTIEHGQLTLRADENGIIETPFAHGFVNYINGTVVIYFYSKTEITDSNRDEIMGKDWYDALLEYTENSRTYINKPVWVDASTARYNAIAYTYIPLDPEILGLSATRLPLDGRVPIFRAGGIGIISATKMYQMADHVAGKTYTLDDQRIAYCELQDSAGTKVPYDMYVVDYDYGKFTLSGDFALNALIPPLSAKYRYQDMGLIKDVQINGQVTFTKPVTHNYSAADSIVGSALVIGDMQARYTRKFVQQTWNNDWKDAAVGGAISAQYNDALYPIQVTNNGAAQERWALVFTDNTNFRIIGETSGQIGTGTVNTDCEPINPVTGAPYFSVKKEGWGAGWVSGNVLRFNTIAATFPIWCIRTVKQSEPSQISDQFQIMLRGDIDRVV
ncbi:MULTISPECIES: hypothetical protein [Acinetobacter]|uniref:Uncharacterized protein n=1 Tax=Acinetobacter piscicola TaxID=2006115 RepID=A0A7S6VX00_9GAMM|nr:MULTISPECIES: hypothetical protein [Acinetobacter]QOW46443.1 hypothetical protein G0028_11350 [Acinetobacter piscicola]QOW46925.1 hypothetical protein G0028_14065 [Acinetobacter piscicola]